MRSRISDPHHFNADPDLNPAFHFKADPDPNPQRCNANLRPLACRPSIHTRLRERGWGVPILTTGEKVTIYSVVARLHPQDKSCGGEGAYKKQLTQWPFPGYFNTKRFYIAF
jgi:hypothetical protein